MSGITKPTIPQKSTWVWIGLENNGSRRSIKSLPTNRGEEIELDIVVHLH